MFVYNFSLICLFAFFILFINLSLKTIFSFNDFSFNFYFLNSIAIILFSISGIPPFIGFFSKLIILFSLINSFFFILYFTFFILLFLGLYFYLQNLRFLYSSLLTNHNYSFFLNVKFPSFFFIFSLNILIFIIFGFLIFDDLFLYFNWLLI